MTIKKKMPELPEIETIVEGAKKNLIGKKIKSVEIRVPKIVNFLVEEFKKGSIGAEIKDIRRFAKIIVVDLSNRNSILIHLKLTGQLIYQERISNQKSQISNKIPNSKFQIPNSHAVGGHSARVYDQPLPHSYTHVIFEFSDGSHLYFNDIRRFGYLKLVKTAEVGERPEIKNLGPEPLAPRSGVPPRGSNWEYQEFKNRLKRRPRSKIKQVLMDQKFVSGIGNIYANEILFHARTRPDRNVGTLTEDEKKHIFASIKFILKKGIAMGGSSENTYVNLEGKKGDFMKYARVYQQKVCKVCGGPIKRITVGGRGTFYCSSCQR